jgi:AraC-like DNA-binding protein
MPSSALAIQHADARDISLAERPLSPGQRVRRWHHRGGTAYVGPGTAHDGVEVAWIESSACRYEIGSSSYDVPADAVMVVASGVEHVTRIGPHLRAGSMLLDTQVLCEIADAIRPGARAPHREARVLVDRPRVTSLARLLDQEAFADEEPGRAMAVEALVEALAVELLRAGVLEEGCRAPHDPRIRRAVDCIHARYTEPLSVDDLARTAGMSRFHFSRLFRDQVGVSPYRYLLSTRVGGAAQRLKSGRSSVTEAAFEVGFHSLGRFSRSFRAELGVSPSEYARVARERRVSA